ncbi:MAG: carbonic anhydrase [Polyangiaceae bacterium]|jgi:carbonic anhydrase|nr:carbonic anhydrase [Polyangiaceae bacterium]
MAFAWRLALTLSVIPSLFGLAGGCKPKQEVTAEPKKVVKKDKPAAKAEKGGHDAKGSTAHAELPDPGKFIVPFAWEAAKDEPLAQTRSFLADVLTDNQGYMEHGDKFFAEFADKQTPRATVLTCADSRVHTTAWDVTPENDDFVIRNIGNQFENAQGSIEYGIEHLRTPILLVIGHTGCGAVKAAMGDMSKLSQPIQGELSHMHLPKAGPGKPPETVWVEAVIANVNSQVDTALKHFAKDIQTGQLTVVGAVYDFRNDLQQGAGKLSIVNVNGNSEPERMTAFVEAITGKSGEPREGKDRKRAGKGGKLDDAAAAAQIAAQIAKFGKKGGAQGARAEVQGGHPEPEHAEHH